MRELDERTREAVAENVRTRRTLLGMSQADLSRASGLSEVSVSNIENRTRSYIRPSTMRKLAMALETTVTALYGVEEGNDGPLAADPLTSPEAARWFSDRAGWEHYAEPAVWLKDLTESLAEGGLDILGERAGRLITERARARRDLQLLRREIEREGAQEGHQDRRDWARDLTRALERHLEREHQKRVKTLEAIGDAMIAQQVEKLPEPRIFEIYEDVNVA